MISQGLWLTVPCGWCLQRVAVMTLVLTVQRAKKRGREGEREGGGREGGGGEERGRGEQIFDRA